MIRSFTSGAKGREFESLRARQTPYKNKGLDQVHRSANLIGLLAFTRFHIRSAHLLITKRVCTQTLTGGAC
jgi:hypothetical protein